MKRYAVTVEVEVPESEDERFDAVAAAAGDLAFAWALERGRREGRVISVTPEGPAVRVLEILGYEPEPG